LRRCDLPLLIVALFVALSGCNERTQSSGCSSTATTVTACAPELDPVELRRLVDQGDSEAMRTLALYYEYGEGEDRAQVVPLLERAASLGNAQAADDLLDLQVATAVADFFGIDRIRPNVSVDPPSRFVSPSASEFQNICSSGAHADAEYCDEAVFQLMLESGQCRGRVASVTVSQTISHIVRADIKPNETAAMLFERSLTCAER
jgi:hypothetical protein